MHGWLYSAPILLERLILLRKFLDSGTNGKRESAEVASATFLWPRNGWVCSVPNLIKGHTAEKSAPTSHCGRDE